MTDIQQDLAFDLRQKYAEIVGLHLEACTHSRLKSNYPQYFKDLENLYTVIKHKFKTSKTAEEGEEEDKKAKKKTDLERYAELRKTAIELANKYQNAFLGLTDDPKEIAEIEEALRSIEMFLYSVMDRAKMFGSVGYNEGM